MSTVVTMVEMIRENLSSTLSTLNLFTPSYQLMSRVDLTLISFYAETFQEQDNKRDQIGSDDPGDTGELPEGVIVRSRQPVAT